MSFSLIDTIDDSQANTATGSSWLLGQLGGVIGTGLEIWKTKEGVDNNAQTTADPTQNNGQTPGTVYGTDGKPASILPGMSTPVVGGITVGGLLALGVTAYLAKKFLF